MSSESLSAKYIENMEKTLAAMQRIPGVIVVSEECINELIGYVKAYLADATYFKEQEKYETSLTSIAYCEGLFDALKLIGAVKIQSP